MREIYLSLLPRILASGENEFTQSVFTDSSSDIADWFGQKVSSVGLEGFVEEMKGNPVFEMLKIDDMTIGLNYEKTKSRIPETILT